MWILYRHHLKAGLIVGLKRGKYSFLNETRDHICVACAITPDAP